MDAYLIQERLGVGAQGRVYLALHKQEQTKYVIKQIECKDESEANQAFKEAMALKSLKHLHICTFKEFFVYWDESIATMYLCIVMDYYAKGDLARLLKDRRQKQEMIPEKTIKDWLGQIISAMSFFHQKGIIHRDLKPSNIFIGEDGHLIVGDFGVSTVIDDIRVRTRTVVGSLNWMAPECLDKGYSEKSDIWSIACIVLEMCTCHVLSSDSGSVAAVLYGLKHNQKSVDDAFSMFEEDYSMVFINLLKEMLSKDERPTTRELCQRYFIKDCIDIYQTQLANKRKKCSDEKTLRALPVGEGELPVIEFLCDLKEHDTSVISALEYLITLAESPEGLQMSDRSKSVVCSVAKQYIKDSRVQMLTLTLLDRLILTADTEDFLYRKEVISIIIAVFKEHMEDLRIQSKALSFLKYISSNEKCSSVVGQLGAIGHVIDALKTFPHKPEVVVNCFNVLWTLAVNEDNSRIMMKQKLTGSIVDFMRRYSGVADLMESGCVVLMSLLIEEQDGGLVNELEIVPLLLSAIGEHITRSNLVRNACLTLSTVIANNEDNAFRVLMPDGTSTEKENEGLRVLTKAYIEHRDNLEVIEELMSLLNELAAYDEIASEMKHLQLKNTIVLKAQKTFEGNEDFSTLCNDTLNAIRKRDKERK